MSDDCQLCGMNPTEPKNAGRQVYVCDRCEALVCSECSEDGPNSKLYCDMCAHELRLDEKEQRGLV